MNTPQISLKAVDRLEITVVLDNSIDVFLPDTDEVKRYKKPPRTRWCEGEDLIAEHGYAALVTVENAGRSATLLFDAGVSTNGLMHNMDVLGVQPEDIHSIVLSHGHLDHTQGLPGLLKRLGPRKAPILLHPDAFLNRKVVLPDGREIRSPPMDRSILAQEGVDLIEERGPSCLLDDLVLVTGQIHRTTDFEKGFPIHYAEVNGEWQLDPFVHDDQALVVHVRDKGLVVMTGCGHAGAINSIYFARQLTGVERIHSLLGGLHLTGPIFEPIIPPTIQALKEINPQVVMTGHCTGWKANHLMASELPEAYVPSSVGTRLVVESGAPLEN